METFDPNEAYCANSCGRLAIGPRTIGIVMDDSVEDGFWEQLELLCLDCLEK